MSEIMAIVGAGPVGTQTARLLADRGERVVLVTRSGRGPDLAGVTRVAVDAADPDALAAAVTGARALFNCANPTDYTVWDRVWPPLADGLLQAAERTGATLVTASCLYGYGPTGAPMVEGQPDLATDHKGRLRAAMWAQARSRHQAGRITAVEVRASDYVGVGVGANGHVTRQLPTVVRGRGAWVIGRPDLPHTWTDVGDMARALVTVADRPDSWGQIWHAPSNEPRTQRQAITDVLATAGHGPVPVRGIPAPALRAVGLVNPLMREVAELSYMFSRPYVMSSAQSQEVLGLTPTPWDEVCQRTATGNPAPAVRA